MLSTKMIGNKIAEARKKEGLSQAQFAEQLFISPQAVGKWERGESMPDITTFNRIADILGVDLNYFSERIATGNKGNEPNKPSAEQTTTPLSEKGNLSSNKEEKKPLWDMSRGNWVDADFSGLKNLQDKFSASNMQRCKFIGSELSGIQLKANNIEGCDFSNSEIQESHIQNSHLMNNEFNRCSLQKSEFSGNYIKGCDFSEANLADVKLKSCSLIRNHVEGAVWLRTSFVEMQIEDIIFDGTIDNCYFDNCSFKKVTFQNAKLINTFFKGRKLKGIQFIDCQADKMTYEFLKNGKASLDGLTILNP
ncbi:pentapeptide repeat-containing protein [Belliella marina]|uniref:Pentapeptide repeat-containing protein n=1 Tax=Belliella marina TaxID=1644146 RepID=A0ABW4VRS3_9BACT